MYEATWSQKKQIRLDFRAGLDRGSSYEKSHRIHWESAQTGQVQQLAEISQGAPV
jgi:hypothetical protein